MCDKWTISGCASGYQCWLKIFWKMRQKSKCIVNQQRWKNSFASQKNQINSWLLNSFPLSWTNYLTQHFSSKLLPVAVCRSYRFWAALLMDRFIECFNHFSVTWMIGFGGSVLVTGRNQRPSSEALIAMKLLIINRKIVWRHGTMTASQSEVERKIDWRKEEKSARYWYWKQTKEHDEEAHQQQLPLQSVHF